MINKDGTVTIDKIGETVVKGNPNVITLNVTNKVRGALPSTGGQGILRFMVIALTLMVITGGLSMVYIYRSRKGGA